MPKQIINGIFKGLNKMSSENIGDVDLENSVSASLDDNTHNTTDLDDINELNDRIDDLMQPHPII